MRVMVVIDSTSGGGAETSLAAMAPYLVDAGIDLEVAYFHEREGVKERLEAAGVKLFHVRPGRDRPIQHLDPISGLVTVGRLRKLIRARRPDLVHTMVFEADIAGRTAAFLTRTPVVSSIINEMYGPEHRSVSRSGLGFRLGWLADVATARFVRRFHAITETAADVMARRLHIDRSLVDVIYRGRDPKAFAQRTATWRSEARRSLGLHDECAVIVAVSRQDPQKGLAFLIEAMPAVLAENPGAVALLAGREGASTPELKRCVEELRIVDSVKFLGHRQDVAELLYASDALVFPSLFEGLGGSLIEAMAVGCPIVCTDLPVLREVTKLTDGDYAAQFFPSGDPDALAKAINLSLAQQPLPDLALRTRERFDSVFQIAAVSREMSEFYRRAVGS